MLGVRILAVSAMVGAVGLLGCHCAVRGPKTGAEVDAPSASAPAPGTGFAVSGPALGPRQVLPGRCVAGGHYQFLGADLVDEERHLVVRAVADPAYGSTIRVFDSKDSDVATAVFHHADCRKLDAELAPTGSMVNGVLYVSLKLDLDCRSREGNTLAGSFTAQECQ